MEGLTAARYQLEAAEKELLMATKSMLYLADTLENMPFAQLKNGEELENEESLIFYENAFENAASVLRILVGELGGVGDRLVKVKGFLKAL